MTLLGTAMRLWDGIHNFMWQKKRVGRHSLWPSLVFLILENENEISYATHRGNF